MQFDSTTILVIGLLLLTLGLYIWLAIRFKKPNSKSLADSKDTKILTKEEKQALKNQAAAAFEASLTREIKLFEDKLSDLSNTLLEDFKKDVISADKMVSNTAMEMTANLSKEYSGLLAQATSTIKANLIAADNELTEQTKKIADDLKTIRQSRQQVIIKRVDDDLADILSQYLNGVLTELDLTDQEQFIMSRLEAIKAPLLEDLKRGN